MATAYWPYRVHIDFRVGQLEYVYELQFVVYKVNKFVFKTLLSFLVLLNIRVCFLSYFKDLSYNNCNMQRHNIFTKAKVI